jgi:hypothetical protein
MYSRNRPKTSDSHPLVVDFLSSAPAATTDAPLPGKLGTPPVAFAFAFAFLMARGGGVNVPWCCVAGRIELCTGQGAARGDVRVLGARLG